MVSTRTFVNAIIGAVVGVALSFIPGSTVLGGAVAGFLEGPDGRAGTIAGVIAGFVMFLPIATGGALVFGFLGLGLLGGVPGGGIAVLSIFVVVALLIVLVYTIGFSVLGGYLGAYLAREYPEKRRRTRDTIGFSTASERPSHAADVPPSPDRDPETTRGWDRDGRSDRDPSAGSDGDRYPDRDREYESDR
ncbi:DUF5518 domain-containing protein [Natrinema pallidum]|uniref:DUF5518 domain-containing protein n=1 Tax=Natrinema pallidum TaxID=69527 RepID=A0A4V1IFG1_9EURY|nr:DUF5518 domain-containing protein [Natrinema pallidum]QCW04874.1 hypothetical protein FGF80_17340 [Natrinema pallidum]